MVEDGGLEGGVNVSVGLFLFNSRQSISPQYILSLSNDERFLFEFETWWIHLIGRSRRLANKRRLANEKKESSSKNHGSWSRRRKSYPRKGQEETLME